MAEQKTNAEKTIHQLTKKVNQIPKYSFPNYIESLSSINSIPLHILNDRLKPHKLSQDPRHSATGFISKNESLMEILIQDNKIVKRYGLTHADLAYPFFFALSEFEKQKGETDFYFLSRRFSIEISVSGGIQHSPFDDGQKSSSDGIIIRYDTQKQIQFSCLLPYLIAAYGFYEGNVPYRLAPQTIIDFFELKPNK